jgi:LacI family transcriptional regulator
MPPRLKKCRSQTPEVALLVETSTTFGRQVLRGIAAYVHVNSPWLVHIEQRSIYDPPPPWLKTWRGDGIISRAAWPQVAEISRKHGIPVVDLNEQVMDFGMPLIANDQAAIGKLAAEHLLDRGFTHFGFIGYRGLPWSDGRRDGLAQTVTARGYSFEEYRGGGEGLSSFRSRKWETESNQIAQWVAALPKPVGIMASNDFRAAQLLDGCRIAAVAVPEQAAVIGVDNEDTVCELATPPLSTVTPGAHHMGYEAASLLDTMMHGKPPPYRELYIAPQGVITRGSTDVMAITDPIVAQAMEFIRRHACDGIQVSDVLREVLISRTALQKRVRQALGRSVHDVIQGIRLQRAEQLLAETNYPLVEVAERAGFKHLQYFSAVFKELKDITPGQYRKEQGHKQPRPFQVRVAQG